MYAGFVALCRGVPGGDFRTSLQEIIMPSYGWLGDERRFRREGHRHLYWICFLG